MREIIPGWEAGGELSNDRLDLEQIARAYRFGELAHAGQKRSSGENYISHAVEVARILVELGLDSTTVSAGLLHDVVEDTTATLEDIEREFGAEIAGIVDG